jgi:hypothetical protein
MKPSRDNSRLISFRMVSGRRRSIHTSCGLSEHNQVTITPAVLNGLEMLSNDRETRGSKHAQRCRFGPCVVKHRRVHQLREQLAIGDGHGEQSGSAKNEPPANAVEHALMLVSRQVPKRVISNDPVERFICKLNLGDVTLYERCLRTPHLRPNNLFSREVDAHHSMATP